MPSAPDSPRPHRAPFIVLEGVDGSGKSTQAQLLAAWLREQGASVVLTREPGGTALGERVRALVKDDCATACVPRAELLLMLAARAQHVAEVIVPALDAGTIVVSDRFSLSTLAYQGAGRGLPAAEIRAADAVATGGLQPDLTLVLDVSCDDAQARTGERFDRFEREGRTFLHRVIAGYREFAAADPRVQLIDGSGSVEAVWQRVRRCVVSLLARCAEGGIA